MIALNPSLRLLLALLFATGADGTASAVSVNARGTGQVLLYPYYTVNGGNDTLLSIVNTTAHGKALRVRFAEGENGRDVYSLNLYLAPSDVWTAAITSGGGTAVARLVSRDHSCTVPGILDATQTGGGGGVGFSTAAFSGSQADGGDSSASRTNEGSIEVTEMGTLVDGSPSAIAAGESGAGQAVARDCASLLNAWKADGYWTRQPDASLVNPSGGVYGTSSIVNVEQGTVLTYGAVALDGFRTDPDDLFGVMSSVTLHTAPGSAHPNLGDALSNPSTHVAEAQTDDRGNPVKATYAAPANAIDAVSAVLMAGTIFDEYVTNAGIGATTNLVFAYPTRRFYTDPVIAGAAAIPPFTRTFAGIRAHEVVETIPYANADQEGATPLIHCGVDQCANRLESPGTSVEILNLGAGAGSILGSALAMGGTAPTSYGPSGQLQLVPDLSSLSVAWTGIGLPPLRFMRASMDHKSFAGLPVIGFAAQNLTNSHVQAGVLANYSSVVPHRTAMSCYELLPDDFSGIAGHCR